MKELTINDISNKLSDLTDLDNIPNFSIEDESDVFKLYDELMNENCNCNKSKDMQLILIENIAQQLDSGVKCKDIKLMYSDNKHMAYYNMSLREGETENIEKVLYENGLSSNIFKEANIKKNMSSTGTALGGRIRIIQEVEKIEGESPVVVLYEIWYDNKCIYHYGKYGNQEENTKNNSGFNLHDTAEKIYETVKNKFKNQKTKSGTIRKSIKVGKIIKEGEEIDVSISFRNGKPIKIYKDSKGRFVKKEN